MTRLCSCNLRLNRLATWNEVYLLWFTTGNADGLGLVRKDELKQSWSNLGIKSFYIIDVKNFPDSMTKSWDIRQVAYAIQSSMEKFPKIDFLLTFDRYGVSRHINHTHVSLGWEKFMDKVNTDQDLKLYKLMTHSILRKFIGIYDVFFINRRSLLDKEAILWTDFNIRDTYKGLAIHKSQFVWYRKLFIIFSSYAYLNYWKLFINKSA